HLPRRRHLPRRLRLQHARRRPPRRARSSPPRHRPRRTIRAHLLRWLPQPHAQRRETTPRARPSVAASHPDPSRPPAPAAPAGRRALAFWYPTAVKILGVIPARLHSTRLPRKVLREIEGVPMVVYVFKRALRCPMLSDLLVATDSEEVVEACHAYHVPAV